MWKPTGRCVELHAVRDEQVPMGPARRFAINFNLTPELARCRSEAGRTPALDPVCRSA